MSRTIVDLTLVEIDGQEIETAKSLEIEKNDPKTPVKTMRRKRRALGYMKGVPDYSATLTCVLPAGEVEIDWDALQKSGHEFPLTYEQAEGGLRRTLVDCVVSDVSQSSNSDGDVTVTVKLNALDERPEA